MLPSAINAQHCHPSHTDNLSILHSHIPCRPADVGKAKAIVAAERVMSRVAGVKVTPHFGRIEDKDPSFYREFNLIVMGLDSLEARSYINSMVCGFLGGWISSQCEPRTSA